MGCWLTFILHVLKVYIAVSFLREKERKREKREKLGCLISSSG